MNVLVVGSGGREHTLAWKLSLSPKVRSVFIAPGNAGTARVGTNIPVDVTDFGGLAGAIKANGVDLVVVGPEGPLVEGIVDFLELLGVRAFGPTKRAAEIEGSKIFAKKLMVEHGIPCAKSREFSKFDEAKRYVEGLPEPPVIKADGLAGGKGVVVSEGIHEAVAALDEIMVKGIFGEAGTGVVVEERLVGLEASVFAFTDGSTVLTTVPACDYKRIGNQDTGRNTGGMGSYSPVEFLDEQMLKDVTAKILVPTVRAMADEGRRFAGVLYAGLMITENGPKVLEFNCRLGDPETQVILPRLQSDLVDVIEAVLDGTLEDCDLRWDPRPCIGVVLASGGYPGEYDTGVPIGGLLEVADDVQIFHGGTVQREDGTTLTAGGRVLTVSSLGADISKAREAVYGAVGRIDFKSRQFRDDIGLRAVNRGH